MDYLPFGELLPEEAPYVTRVIRIRGRDELPDGEYGFVDLYCTDPDCDCRRILVWVVSEKFPKEVLATISYGWESRSFYCEWLGDDDEDWIDELKGPALSSMHPQSKMAPFFLYVFQRLIEDKTYVQQLKRRYWMVKKALRDK